MQHNSQQNWGISKRSATLLFLAPVLGLVLIVVAHFASEDVWRKIGDEDSLIEWFQFAGFAISSTFCFSIGYRLATRRRVVPAFLYSLLALGLTFVAGEEIAWGQRLLGMKTPDALAEVNEKREISVHNVGSLSELFNVAKFAIGLYGTIGCCVQTWLSNRRDMRPLEIFVVPWFLSSAFLVILVQRLLRWTLLQDSVPRGYGEVDESCFAFGMTAFVVLVWRRVYRLDANSMATGRAGLFG